MTKLNKFPFYAEPLVDLTQYLQGLELVSMSLSQAGHLLVLTAKHPLDYREVDKNGGASFAKAHPKTSNDFLIFEFKQGLLVKTTEVTKQMWNYHFVQPLPNDELLLVCGRVRGEINNARVFNSKGVIQRDFTLGDGIQHVQTTEDGQIWVGYFDEGVFGSGLSQNGINCFDKSGSLIYSHTDKYMADCYALNVVSNTEVWSCYYTEFPLVQIENYQVKNTWDSPVRGSHSFLVWKNFVLFSGGYKEIDEDDFLSLKGYQLLEVIPNQIIKELAAVEVLIPQESEPGNCWILARGSKMLLIDETFQCYKIELQDVVASYYKN